MLLHFVLLCISSVLAVYATQGYDSTNEKITISHVVPENSHIPEHKLEEILTSKYLSIINQLNIPWIEVHRGLSSSQLELSRCLPGPDYEGTVRYHGCYIAVFVCDELFSGRCYWSFLRRCSCPKFWFLKTYECRIRKIRVPLEASEYKYADVPVGECRLAVWVLVFTILLAITFSLSLIYFLFRTMLKEYYLNP